MSKTVAIVEWGAYDGVARVLGTEVAQLGHTPCYFLFNARIPANADIVLSFAPYGRFLQIPRQLSQLPPAQRPTFVHWSTENPPDIRLPWALNATLANARSQLDPLFNRPRFASFKERMARYRIMGDYLTAHANGWLDIFVESSLVFADFYSRHGLPTQYAFWGSVPAWSADLQLERDIDVLWMGQRRTRRRSDAIEKLRGALTAAGYSMYVADGVENPFLYGMERTRMLNRAKVTLSLLAQAPHDNIFHYRFRLAAPNRSLLFTEQELAHCTLYQNGEHYVEAKTGALTETLLYYLSHEQERRQIVENAYALATGKMTLGASVKSILETADKFKRRG